MYSLPSTSTILDPLPWSMKTCGPESLTFECTPPGLSSPALAFNVADFSLMYRALSNNPCDSLFTLRTEYVTMQTLLASSDDGRRFRLRYYLSILRTVDQVEEPCLTL